MTARWLGLALFSTTALTALPAEAAAPGVYADCQSSSPRPTSIDLNCQRADATLTALRWKGKSAKGFFNYPSYDVDVHSGLVSLRARVRASRPALVGEVRQFTRLRITLAGKRRDRDGQPKHLTYVLTCDISQGWIPARAADPC